MKVYLVGPMRGCPNLNHEAFDRAAKEWREAGHAVRNAADANRAAGIKPGWSMSPAVLRQLMARNMRALSRCNAVALLPGWEQSRGSRAEVAFALALDPPCRFFGADMGEQLSPPFVSATAEPPRLEKAVCDLIELLSDFDA